MVLLALVSVVAIASTQETLAKVFQGRDMPALRRLMTRANVNVKDTDGKPPLLLATSSGWKDATAYLLSLGADPNATGPEGETPLMVSAHSTDLETPRKLLKAGANPAAADKTGSTAIHRCVNWTQYDAFWDGLEEALAAQIETLFKAGANLNAKDSLGRTPLMWASGWRHLPSQQALIRLGAQIETVDPEGRSALTWCASDGSDADNVKTLLKAGAKVRYLDALILGRAKEAEAMAPSAEELRMKGPYQEDALARAAECGSPVLVERLLAAGFSPTRVDEIGGTALFWATGARRSPGQMRSYYSVVERSGADRGKVIELLCKAGADPRAKIQKRETLTSALSEGDTPLDWAIPGGSVPAVKALIAAGARFDPRTFDKDLWDPVAKPRNVAMVEFLLNKGVDPSETNAIHIALWHGWTMTKQEQANQVRIADLLWSHGARIEPSILLSIARFGSPGAVKWLMAHGADVRFVDENKETALHEAAKTGNKPACEVLLSHGARRDAKNTDRKTPADLALEKGFKELAALLKGGIR